MIQQKHVLVGLPTKAFNAPYTEHRGASKRLVYYTLDLVIKTWSDCQTGTWIKCMLRCIHHCCLCDTMTFLAQVQWYNDMVWKNLDSLILFRNLQFWPGSFKTAKTCNSPNLEEESNFWRSRYSGFKHWDESFCKAYTFFNNFQLTVPFLLAAQLGRGRSEITTEIHRLRTPTTKGTETAMNCKTFSNLASINVICTSDHMPLTCLKG